MRSDVVHLARKTDVRSEFEFGAQGFQRRTLRPIPNQSAFELTSDGLREKAANGSQQILDRLLTMKTTDEQDLRSVAETVAPGCRVELDSASPRLIRTVHGVGYRFE